MATPMYTMVDKKRTFVENAWFRNLLNGFKLNVTASALCLCAMFGAPSMAQVEGPALPSYDVRIDDAAVRQANKQAFSPAMASSRQAAVAALERQVPGVRVSFDEILETPSFIRSTTSFLTSGASPNNWKADLTRFVEAHRDLYGIDPALLDTCRVSRDIVTKHNGVHSITLQQQIDGLDLIGAELRASFTATGALINVSSTLLPIAPTAGAAAKARISPEAATEAAAKSVGITPRYPLAKISQAAGTAHVFGKTPDYAGNPSAKEAWFPLSRTEARPVWVTEIPEIGPGNVYSIVVDSTDSRPLFRRNLTEYASTESASYRVYTSDSPSPLSPGRNTPDGFQPPLVSRSLQTLNYLDGTASPDGWINDGNNETVGNNVDAHTDTNADNSPDLPRPAGSPYRVFDFAMDLGLEPSTYRPAAVTQLFYLNNFIHDRLYQLGFDEASGNFQTNNFSRGGLGNDPVQADAQDGSGTNNANFSTPGDGSAPRMQMFTFTGPTPDRDGDFDADIVIHEYVHGLSNRLHGGLSSTQSRGMGEGWSDFYALCLLAEAGDDPRACYAAGGYATYQLSGLTDNYYFGIRRFPYSTDMNKNPETFADIDPGQISFPPAIPRSPIIGNTASSVHNVGEVWCVTLWNCRAYMIEKHGFAGNEIMLRNVTDAMKLSPANPTFVQARDAILQADLVNNGGSNHCELWTGFAERGLGLSATAPPASTTTGVVEAYDTPPNICVSSLGQIEFNASVYSCAGTLCVELRDLDLSALSTQDIELSTTGGDDEPITLTANPPGSGIFTGCLPTSSDAPAPGDGTVQGGHGNNITVTYYDADDGGGSSAVATDTAVFDCQPPDITNVAFTDVSINQFTITFNTDEPATATASGGLSCGLSTISRTSPSGIAHEMTFTGLDECTAYFLSIEAADAAGNETTDSNGGICHKVVTFTSAGGGFFDDFEGPDQGWTHQLITNVSGTADTWNLSTARSASGTKAWHTGPTASGSGDTALISPVINMPATGAMLTFKQWYYFDDCASPTFEPDGGIVEVKVLPSGPWTQITPSGGYPYVLNDGASNCSSMLNPLETRAAYAHNTGGVFVPAEFDLAAYAGQTVQFRFHVGWDCGNCTVQEGWYIDDVQIGAVGPCDDLTISPNSPIAISGPEGGPFSPACESYLLTNSGTSPINWTTSLNQTWITVTPGFGALSPGSSVNVDVCITGAVNAFPPGNYGAEVSFTNQTSGVSQTRDVTLQVIDLVGELDVEDSILPINDLTMPFGSIIVGQTRTEQVEITNTDPTHEIEITTITLDGSAAPPPASGYQENFNDGLAQDWIEDVDADWSVVSGEYRCSTAGSGSMVAKYGGDSFDDFSYEVKVRRTEASSGNPLYILFRATADFEATPISIGSVYAFGISDAGAYYVVRQVGGSVVNLISSTSGFLNPMTSWNTLRVVASGPMLYFYINGNLVNSLSDSALTAGLVGVMGFPSSSFYFDDVVVGDPSFTSLTISGEQQWHNETGRVNGKAGWNNHVVSTKTGDYPGGYRPMTVQPATGMSALGDPFQLQNLPPLPLVLPPGGAVVFDVAYQPTATGNHAGNLLIESDDQDETSVTVALSGAGIADVLVIDPESTMTVSGSAGGPFTPDCVTYSLVNTGTLTLDWTLSLSEPWLEATPASGTLTPGASTSVDVCIVDAATGSLSGGAHPASLLFTNETTLAVQERELTLNIVYADLAVTKTDAPDPVVMGTPLTYTLQVTNAGPNDATAVTLVDTLPTSFTLTSAVSTQGACAQDLENVICELGTLSVTASGPPAWTARASSPVPLTCVAADPATGFIYAQANSGTAFYRYTPASNSWQTLTSCPVSSGNNGGATVIAGKYYAMYTENATMAVYDIAANTWSTASTGATGGTGNISTDGTYLYAMSGSTLARYNPSGGTWDYLASAPLSFERWGASAVLDGYLYATQGNGYSGFARYNISSNTWQTMPSVPGGSVLGGAMDPAGRKFYTYGSYSGSSLYQYDIDANVWQTTTLPGALTPVNDGGMAYVAQSPRRIYAIQGESTTGFAALEIGGASATVTIVGTPTEIGTIVNVATVSLSGSDPVTANNTAVTTTTVIGAPQQAINPNPPHNATNQSRDVNLSWSDGGGAESYDVYFGTTNPPPFVGNQTSTTFEPGTLASLTTYYWRIDAKNFQGTTTGNVWQFSTLDIVDYYTELFSAADNDLDFQTLTFAPDGTGSFYRVCRETASAFPTDPSGGTALALSDDMYQSIALLSGQTAKLYGVSYSTIHVGSNGYLTFISGDSTLSESFANHFSQPRVSALFDDLNPGAGGTESWKQLSDRVAITFQSVPEYSSGLLNSFQYELFFDGTIRLTWLGTGISDGLAGLSRGNGQPPDFVESNLNGYGCTPPDSLSVTPSGVFASAGSEGGPFIPNCRAYTLTNNGLSALNWAVTTSQPWLEATPGSGSLTAGSSVIVNACLTAAADSLLWSPVPYTDTLNFTNTTSGFSQGRAVTLTVNQPLADIDVGPTSFTFAQNPDEVRAQTMTVANEAGLGAQNLTFTIGTASSGGGGGTTLDTIGGTAEIYSGMNRYRGNVFETTQATTLKLIEPYLNFSGTVSLQYVVFESTSLNGTYNRILEQTVSRTGVGAAFYASNPINIALTAGRFYVVAVGWGGNTVTYYATSTAQPNPVSFGRQRNGFLMDSYPLGTTTTNPTAVLNYYQRLTTGNSWLSASPTGGSNAPGAFTSVSVTADSTGMSIGTYQGLITVNNNDPDENPTTIPVTLIVGNDIYVATTGSDATGDGSAGNPYRTIQMGVNSVAEGFAVRIASGLYAEDVQLDCAFALTLIGTGGVTADSFTLTNGTTLTSETTGVSAPLVNVDQLGAAGARINDALVLIASAGTINVGAGTYYERLAVDKNVTIIGDSGTGTEVGPGPAAPVLDAAVTGCAVQVGSIINSTVATITGFVIRNGSSSGSGAAVLNHGSLTLTHSLVGYNTSASGGAIFSAGSGITLAYDLVSSNTQSGIEFSAGSATVTSCTVAANGANALVTSGTASVLVSASVLDGNSAGAGLLVAGGTATITSSTLCENSVGLHYESGALTATLDHIERNTTGVVVAAGDISAADIHVNYCHIDANTSGALNLAATGVLDAQNNWWGSCYGPKHSSNITGKGDSVGNSIDFDPWYDQGQVLDDIDGDGILNAWEDINLNGVLESQNETNAGLPGATLAARDSDGDGFEDGVEVRYGSDPLSSSDSPPFGVPFNSTADSDGDGFKDFYEYAFGSNHADSSSRPSLMDINSDGVVTGADAIILKRIIVGTLQGFNYRLSCSDLNRDGQITGADAIILQRFVTLTIAAVPTI